jgi:hypothetical protein
MQPYARSLTPILSPEYEGEGEKTELCSDRADTARLQNPIGRTT